MADIVAQVANMINPDPQDERTKAKAIYLAGQILFLAAKQNNLREQLQQSASIAWELNYRVEHGIPLKPD